MGVCLQGRVCIQGELGRPPSPPGTMKAGGTHPTGMLSCYTASLCQSLGWAPQIPYQTLDPPLINILIILPLEQILHHN